MTATPPCRVLVIGPPGVGKSWIATRLADRWALPHIQLDSLKLGPVRAVRSTEEFQADLRRVVADERWLLDGNWQDDDLAADVWAQVDLVVWLDYPRSVVMGQVLVRSARRWWTREDYFGWTERIRDWLSPTHPIRWSWKMVNGYRNRYQQMTSRLDSPVVRLANRTEAASFAADPRCPQNRSSS